MEHKLKQPKFLPRQQTSLSAAKASIIFLLTIAVFSAVVFYFFQNLEQIEPAHAQGATYYASNTARGDKDGSSFSHAFQIADFLELPPNPGDTLILENGRYSGERSMIKPTNYDYDSNDKCSRYGGGSQGNPITIKAQQDGKVEIDGQGNQIPVHLLCQQYYIIEGINAHDSSGSVFSISYSKNNIIRRSIGWDALDGNTNIFGVHYDGPTLLEDVAGFGIARKIFSGSQRGNELTIRRAWGSWDGSHEVGPKMTYTLGYNNYDMICENCISTWTGSLMEDSYTLTKGGPNADCYYTSSCGWGGYIEYDSNYGKDCCKYNNQDVNQPYGLFSKDGFKENKRANNKLLGSIAYTDSQYKFKGTGGIYITKASDYEVKDSISYMEYDKAPFYLGSFNTWAKNTECETGYAAGRLPKSFNGHFYSCIVSGTSGSSEPSWPTNGGTVIDGTVTWKDEGLSILDISDSTGIGMAVNTLYRWNEDNNLYVTSVDELTEDVFTGSQGANICHRYENGLLTNEPLWPWPMEQRIYDATLLARGEGVSVTAKIEEMFGEIPNQCLAFSGQTCESSDLVCDSTINIQDLNDFKNLWGQSGMADSNQDDITNALDLGIMMSTWRNY